MRQTEPTSIIKGETLEWTKSYGDYPATTWQLNYYFRGPGVGFNAAWGTEVVADGDDFVITVPTTKTDDLTVAGRHKWEAWVTEAADVTNKQLVGSGYVTVYLAANQASTAAVELRSLAKQIVDSIDAAMLAFGTSDVQEYEITTPAGSRRVKRSDRKMMMETREYYAKLAAGEIAKERVRHGGAYSKPIFARLNG